jgi:hypothetical protein
MDSKIAFALYLKMPFKCSLHIVKVHSLNHSGAVLFDPYPHVSSANFRESKVCKAGVVLAGFISEFLFGLAEPEKLTFKFCLRTMLFEYLFSQ